MVAFSILTQDVCSMSFKIVKLLTLPSVHVTECQAHSVHVTSKEMRCTMRWRRRKNSPRERMEKCECAKGLPSLMFVHPMCISVEHAIPPCRRQLSMHGARLPPSRAVVLLGRECESREMEVGVMIDDGDCSFQNRALCGCHVKPLNRNGLWL